VVEGSACNYSHPTWKSTTCIMVEKVLQTASWVHVHSLPQAQHVHTYKVNGMCAHTSMAPTIERCGSFNHVWNAMEKIRGR
jgi:hypothetical protein